MVLVEPQVPVHVDPQEIEGNTRVVVRVPQSKDLGLRRVEVESIDAGISCHLGLNVGCGIIRKMPLRCTNGNGSIVSI